MAFSPLPKDFEEALKEVKMWRGRYKPQRLWVGLTEEEMKRTCYEVCSYDPYTVARAIEAKIKEKNT
jgi:hypothetical protein